MSKDRRKNNATDFPLCAGLLADVVSQYAALIAALCHDEGMFVLVFLTVETALATQPGFRLANSADAFLASKKAKPSLLSPTGPLFVIFVECCLSPVVNI
jgi:hypothetical protein